MSEPTPLVTVADLANWLGAPVVDTRAQLIIDKVILLAQAAVSPAELPEAASGIVLQIVTRNYANIQGNSMETLGIQQVQRAVSGITLSDDERAALSEAAGFGGGKAFSVDTAPNAGSELPPYYPYGSYPVYPPGSDILELDPSWGYIAGYERGGYGW